MPFNARRAGAVAATLLCVMTPSVVHAQAKNTFLGQPLITEKPPHPLRGSATATPTATATSTATATRTATPTPTATRTATPTPTATAKPGGSQTGLADTGLDAVAVALGGLSLLGFGLSLRMALDNARRDD
jgi:carbohydrate-binding DOMON domain-containing protein